MSKSLTGKTKGKFKAMSEFVHVLPLKADTKIAGVELSSVGKKPTEKGTVLSVGLGRTLADGTKVAPEVKEGDLVMYNPHLFTFQLKQDGEMTVIGSAMGILGKFE